MKNNSTKRFLALLLAFVMIATSGIMTAGFSLLANENDSTADTQTVQEVSTGEDAEAAEAVSDETAEPAEAAEEVSEDTAAAEEAAAGDAADTADETGEEAAAAEQKDADVKVSMPAQKFTEKAGDVTVKVTADEGAFPVGTMMHVTLLTDREAIEEASKAASASEKVVDAVAVDITFRNADGGEIEPAQDGLVTVKIDAGRKLDGDSFDVTHITDDGKAEDIEATRVNAKGATFDADAFSIYVVSGTEEATRTVKFYESKEAMENGEDPIETQVAANGGTITEPEVPDVEEGTNQKFKGWSADGSTYYTFGDITGLTEDEEVKLYPVFTTAEKQHQIFYWDYMNLFKTSKNLVIWTDKANEGDSYVPMESLTDDVNTIDESDPDSHPAAWACVGWTTDWAKGIAGEGLEESITISDHDVNLYPVIRAAHWIVFEENGGTYVKPEYVINGEQTTEPEAPTKEGYSFEGWYTDEELTEKFEFGGTLDDLEFGEDLTLYAKWNAQETTYTVLYWKEELVNGKYEEGNYSSTYIASKGYTAVSGTAVNEDLLTEEIKSGKDVSEEGSETDNDLSKFYHFGHIKSADEEIAGDGSTIVNVYFDINEYEIYFTSYRWNTLTMDGMEYKNEASNVRVASVLEIGEASTDDAYHITVHYGESLKGKWPYDSNFTKATGDVTDPKLGTNVELGNWGLGGWRGNDDWGVITAATELNYELFDTADWETTDGSKLMLTGYWQNLDESVVRTNKVWFEKLDSSDSEDTNNYELDSTYDVIDGEGFAGSSGQPIEGFTYKGNLNTYGYSYKYIGALNWKNTKYTYIDENGDSTKLRGRYKYTDLTSEESAEYTESQPTPVYIFPVHDYEGRAYTDDMYNFGSTVDYNKYSVEDGYSQEDVDQWHEIIKVMTKKDGTTKYVATTVVTEANYYYARNSYNIDFYNKLGYTTEEGYVEDQTVKQLIKEDSALYQENLKDYYFEPTTTRENVEFVGWYTTETFEEGTEVTEEDFANMTMPADNIILYAKWSDSKINITFDAQNGDKKTTFEKFPGEKIDEVENPTKDGYTFMGWYLEDDNGNLTEPYSFDTKLFEDTEIFARWRFDGDIKIVYDLDGGTWAGDNDDVDDSNTEKDMTYKNAETARTTKVKVTPDSDNQVFYGWKINGEGTLIRPNEIFDIDSDDVEYETGAEYGTITLVAVYGPKSEEASILFNANGGSGDDYTKALGNNEKYTLVKASGLDMTKDGYTFTGWNTKSDGSGTSYKAGSIIRVTGTDNVLYAQWKNNTYTATVKYVDGDGNNVSAQKKVTYEGGDDGITIEVPSVAGYTPSRIIVNGETITLNGRTGSIHVSGTMPAMNLSISVIYSKDATATDETDDADDNTAAATTTVARGGGGGAAAAVAAAPTVAVVAVDDEGDVTLTEVPAEETPAALLEDTEACNLIPFLFMAIAMVVEAFNNKNSKTHKKRMEDLLG